MQANWIVSWAICIGHRWIRKRVLLGERRAMIARHRRWDVTVKLMRACAEFSCANISPCLLVWESQNAAFSFNLIKKKKKKRCVEERVFTYILVSKKLLQQTQALKSDSIHWQYDRVFSIAITRIKRQTHNDCAMKQKHSNLRRRMRYAKFHFLKKGLRLCFPLLQALGYHRRAASCGEPHLDVEESCVSGQLGNLEKHVGFEFEFLRGGLLRLHCIAILKPVRYQMHSGIKSSHIPEEIPYHISFDHFLCFLQIKTNWEATPTNYSASQSFKR